MNRETEDLITAHLVLVRRIAWHLCRRLPRSVEVEELIGAGNLALVRCAGAFDSDRNVKFSTYAGKCALGGMLVYLRRLDPLTRLERRRIGKGQMTTNFADLPENFIESLVGSGSSPLEHAIISSFLAKCDLQTANAIQLYFWHGLTQKQIGDLFGVSAGYVSQKMRVHLRIENTRNRQARKARAAG